jgi:hypothetical protein
VCSAVAVDNEFAQEETIKPKILSTLTAYTAYQQVAFAGLVSLWQFDSGYLNLKATGFTAPPAFKMHVVVAMVR